MLFAEDKKLDIYSNERFSFTVNESTKVKAKLFFYSERHEKVESKPPETSSSSTFKPDMPPPPSPASSTCSDHSGHSMVSPGPLSE